MEENGVEVFQILALKVSNTPSTPAKSSFGYLLKLEPQVAQLLNAFCDLKVSVLRKQ